MAAMEGAAGGAGTGGCPGCMGTHEGYHLNPVAAAGHASFAICPVKVASAQLDQTLRVAACECLWSPHDHAGSFRSSGMRHQLQQMGMLLPGTPAQADI